MNRRVENWLLALALGAFAIAGCLRWLRADTVVQFPQWPVTVGSASGASTTWTDPYAAYLKSLITQQTTNSTGISDSSGNGHHMRSIPDVPTGPTMKTIGGTNELGTEIYVSDYDGADDLHTLPTVGGGSPISIIPSTANFTWAMWANTDVLPPDNDWDFVASQWNDDGGVGRIGINVQDWNNGQDDKWEAVVSATNGADGWIILYSTDVAVVGAWTHLCLTRNGNNWIFYVNGVSNSGAIDPYPRTLAGLYYQIAETYNGVGAGVAYRFNGQIGEVALYTNMYLTAAEVSTLYSETSPTNYLRAP